MVLKPQDVLILLKLVSLGDREWSYVNLAGELRWAILNRAGQRPCGQPLCVIESWQEACHEEYCDRHCQLPPTPTQ